MAKKLSATAVVKDLQSRNNWQAAELTRITSRLIDMRNRERAEADAQVDWVGKQVEAAQKTPTARIVAALKELQAEGITAVDSVVDGVRFTAAIAKSANQELHELTAAIPEFAKAFESIAQVMNGEAAA